GPATLLLGPIRRQHCISDGSQRRNTASAPLARARSPIHYPPITRSWRLDSFRHPAHRDQIAIERGGIFLASTPRGFLPWTLSDDGPSACRIVPTGRRPKPFTQSDSRWRGRMIAACAAA